MLGGCVALYHPEYNHLHGLGATWLCMLSGMVTMSILGCNIQNEMILECSVGVSSPVL